MKKKEILLLLALLSLAYVLYSQLTRNELNLTTGMIFLAGVSVLLFLVSETAMRILKRSKNTTNNMRLLLATICFSQVC